MMTQVAAQDPRLRAVVLEAPPPSFDDYIRLHCTRWGILSEWPARWAIRDSGLLDTAVEPVKLIDKIAPRPVLILAGSLDHDVSAALVTKLYDAARDPKALWIVDGAQHGGYIDVAAAEYARRLTDFFAKGLRSPEPPRTPHRDGAAHCACAERRAPMSGFANGSWRDARHRERPRI
jgi:pimeloyl-ACP methyl ester carboxylesterase